MKSFTEYNVIRDPAKDIFGKGVAHMSRTIDFRAYNDTDTGDRKGMNKEDGAETGGMEDDTVPNEPTGEGDHGAEK